MINEKEFMSKYEDIEQKYDFVDVFLEIPNGWINLVDQMFQEIKNYLDEAHINKEDFGFLQIKEKWGRLRVYWYGPEEIGDIIYKYEEMSERVCSGCGKPATKISQGWICPWCDECAAEIGGSFVNVENI